MKTEEAKKLVDQALEQLATTLAKGKSEALKAYLAAMSRFHRYSVSNVLLILWQRPGATYVAGYRTWQKLGRFVRKGEKGIAVFAPILVRPKADADEVDDEPEQPHAVRFKMVHVFDVAQTEGAPLPEVARVRGDPGGWIERLEAYIAVQGIALSYVEDLGSADGMSSGGAIKVRASLPPAEKFAVLVHELAHELLHKGEPGQRPPKTVRETEAEVVAFVVCEAVGLDTNTASADYIQLYQGDKETLTASLERIQATAARIISALHVPSAQADAA